MSAGVIYGMHIEPSKTDGPMKCGPVVTLCVRLPEWCVLEGAAETVFRARLHEAMRGAIEVVTESDASKARRLEQTVGKRT